MAEFFEEDVPHEEDRFARRNRHGVAGIAGTGPGCEGPAGRSRNCKVDDLAGHRLGEIITFRALTSPV
jgi:hypothetical protein